jgi:radical SAM superfamily enzyme YgiQ (UPF0313 family)
MPRKSRLLLVKPPDRFLEDEFVYQQLGPHYLQSFLMDKDFEVDILILYESREGRAERMEEGSALSLKELKMMLMRADGTCIESGFSLEVFEEYSIVGFSVMTPQAVDAYMLNELIRGHLSHIITVIGGSHARYYLDKVVKLPKYLAFDFIVPQDGWQPMLDIMRGAVQPASQPVVLEHNLRDLKELPAPTRPLPLMRKYNFSIAGAPAFHTVTALGCPFTCHFCESGVEAVRRFSEEMIEADLLAIRGAHDSIGNERRSVMFFDDVGLVSPKQVERLSSAVSNSGFDTWRAFTHAYLIVKHEDRLLLPFVQTGGRRVGIGVETGSQRSLDLINKRNGKRQDVRDHYEAIRIANENGIAVDAFTMIYPWEDQEDLDATTRLVEFVSENKVNGTDLDGRPLRNHVDSTIMTPYQGTKFYDLMLDKKIPYVELAVEFDPGAMYYKGIDGGSGWPYKRSRLPKEEYEAVQRYRNSLRPSYR